MLNISAITLQARETEGCVQPANERLIVTHDGLRIALHRLIWMHDGRELLPTDFLLSECCTVGCVQPKHYTRSRQPYRAGVACRNGHVYTAEDLTERGRVCHVCAEQRRARRRRGGLPNWAKELQRQFCPQGHAYTPENTYIETTPRGQKRHCRACTIARAAGLDPADVVAA